MNHILIERLAHRQVAERARTRPVTGYRRSARLIQLEIKRAREADHQ